MLGPIRSPIFIGVPRRQRMKRPQASQSLRSTIGCAAPLGANFWGKLAGCCGWVVMDPDGEWSMWLGSGIKESGKPPESLLVQMKYSFWFDCPKNGWKKMWTRIFQGSWKPNCRPVRRRDDMDQWMDIAFTITHYHAMFRQIKYNYHGEMGSESTPALIPTPGMHKLVDHKSRAATDANGADEIRFFIFALPKAQLLRHLHWISMVQDCHVGFFWLVIIPLPMPVSIIFFLPQKWEGPFRRSSGYDDAVAWTLPQKKLQAPIGSRNSSRRELIN